jgi:hypothetical protein
MTPRAFTREDLPTINAWLAARDLAHLQPGMIPETGFIVEGVAVGFLYDTDSQVGFMENFISNPASSAVKVSEAINAIVDRLLQASQVLGIRYMVVMTKKPGVIKRARRWGFGVKPGPWAILQKEVLPWAA